MLTVRVNGIHGDVVVFQAARVIRGEPLPAVANANGNQSPPESFGHIEFYDEKHEAIPHPADYGTVFVMNDQGKTVAKWDLGGWAMPA